MSYTIKNAEDNRKIHTRIYYFEFAVKLALEESNKLKCALQVINEDNNDILCTVENNQLIFRGKT